MCKVRMNVKKCITQILECDTSFTDLDLSDEVDKHLICTLLFQIMP
jgi:hypothetical protein